MFATKIDADQLIVRIAALEIDPNSVEEYLAILKEEAAQSVKVEAGVVCIFPMYEKERPHQIKLLEIYANQAAYESHLKTPHFQHYKTTTKSMVKSLELMDMEVIDKDMLVEVFRKMKK